MKFVKYAIEKYNFYLFFLLIIIVLLSSIVTLFPAESMRKILKSIEDLDINLLKEAIFFMLSVFLIKNILAYLLKLIEVYLIEKQSIKLELKSIKLISNMQEFYKKFISYGNLSVTINNNISDYISNFVFMIRDCTFGIGILVATIFYIFNLNIYLATVFLSYQFLIISINKIWGNKIKALINETIAKKKLSSSIVFNILENFLTVKLLNKKSLFFIRENFIRNEKLYKNLKIKLDVNTNTLNDLLSMFAQIGQILIICGFGGYLVGINKCSVSTLIAFFSCQFQIMKVVSSFTNSFISYKTSKENFKSLKYILLKDKDIYTSFKPKEYNNFRSLSYENINFSINNKLIINNSKFTINRGDKILIKGTNGSGKSTLIKLILGLYEFDSGKILLDDVIVDNSELINFFVYIPQNPKLFNGTIRDNITLGIINDIKYNKILKELNLEDLQNKYDENSNFDNFSDGEKQRICISRALFHAEENSIIICDEIFSCLDFKNKNIILKLLNQEYGSNTIVMTIHDEIDMCFDKELHIIDNKVKEKKLYV